MVGPHSLAGFTERAKFHNKTDQLSQRTRITGTSTVKETCPKCPIFPSSHTTSDANTYGFMIPQREVPMQRVEWGKEFVNGPLMST